MNAHLNHEQRELVVNNYHLVHYLVNKLRINPSSYDDIVSIGTIGLCKAAATFSINKNAKFATYASICINNEIFMQLRKNKKQILSLDNIIYQDANGNELTLMDTLPDPVTSVFDKQIQNAIIIDEALSYILNVLPRKEAIILLFSMANVNQKEIADIMGLSQSYISRLTKKLHDKVKKYESSNNYKKVFTMALKNNQFEFSFWTTDVVRFNKLFEDFLIGIPNANNLQSFNINCTHDRVSIYLPAEIESFAFVAQIIQEIENFIL